MVLPLLLVIVCAIIDFGRIYQSNVSLTNAVREGARRGASGGTGPEAEARVSATAPNLTLSDVTASVGTTTGDDVLVSATATVTLITPLGSLMTKVFHGTMSSSFPITAKADMRLE